MLKYLFKIGTGMLLLLLWLYQPLSAQTMDSVAENMLLYQRADGGWTKSWSKFKIDYTKPLSTAKLDTVIKEVKADNFTSTIDNDATTTEIKYLLKTYKKTSNKKYLAAAAAGVRYLLAAQYANGGWAQFFPAKKGYYTHITYNDNAMIHVMQLLQQVAEGTDDTDVLDKEFVEKSKKAVAKGVDCILKTQVVVDGHLTVWCAQHDEVTLKPANARAYELVSLSGLESVPLVAFLMRVKTPSPEIVRSVKAAVAWFEQVKMTGYDFVTVPDPTQEKGIEKYLVRDPKSTIWARFYHIGSNEPFVCGTDGIPRASVTEIGHERRVGYLWYGRWPAALLSKDYPEWLQKISVKQ